MNSSAPSIGNIANAPASLSSSFARLRFWTAVAVAIGSTSIVLGLIWDISWHMTIGRDTFWTPAHIATYFGGALSGFACGWLAIRTTYFGTDADRAQTVNLWGGRAPYGAWIVIWGAVTMIASGPFDNWWHNAYGLDVKIISPPHVVLFAGIFAVILGGLLLVLREQNESGSNRQRAAAWLFVYVGGILLVIDQLLFLTESWPNRQHTAEYYFLSACIYPGVLIAIARVSRMKWAATFSAAFGMLLMAAMTWILPLFEASPKLGPIRHLVDHMVPLPFPALWVLPAVVVDLLKQRVALGVNWRRDLVLSAIVAALFLAVFIPVQWHFSRFIISPAADNWFFAGNRSWGYNNVVGDRSRVFWGESDPLTALMIGKAFLAAFISAGVGLSRGNWMVRVKR